MDVVRLDPETYLPDLLLENETSVVWTERYTEPGDFEITTSRINESLVRFPPNTLISLMDTEEVMIVEDQLIETNDDGIDELKIVGRSYESFLENRALVGDLKLGGPADKPDEDPPKESKWKMQQTYQASEAVALIIWNSVVHPKPVITGVNAKRGGPGGNYPPYEGNLDNILDNTIVTISGVAPDASQTWHLELGEVHERILEIMQDVGVGIRMIRPNARPGGTMQVMTFAPGGTPIKTATPIWAINEMCFDIYHGTNRTVTGPGVPVVFEYSTGDIDTPKYMWSRKGYKNIALVDSDELGLVPVANYAGALTSKGLLRREGYGASDTERGMRNASSYFAALEQEGRRRLRGQRPQSILDGSVSPESNYRYKQHYFLGDYVTMRAKYGVQQTMRVTEYIRTDDRENGEQGYPTLTINE